MIKLKSYKMYAFNNADIVGNEININSPIDLKAKEVRLSENFLIKAYCVYADIEFSEGLLITDIIKVMLSDGENKSREQVQGIKFNHSDYIAWFSTPGQMKKDDMDTHSKCEFYFVKKEMKEFMDIFERLISLGKLKAYEGKEVCINKDVIARIALATSSTFETSIVPKIIILPECNNIVTSNIVTIIDDEVKEIYENEPNEDLRKLRNVDTTAFDGCGIMSLNLAEKIKQEMGLDYDVTFAGIRMYNGLAVKGLVTAVDFIKYFDEFYAGDTEYFRYNKEQQCYEIKDMFNDWQCANDADLLLNETQVKWAKHFIKKEDSKTYGMEQMKNKLNRLNAKEYIEYKALLTHLYITKVNKNETKTKDHILTNYQLLSNIATTEKEIDTLSASTEKVFRDILDGNEDVARIFWGDTIKTVGAAEDGDEPEEVESASTQAQHLLQINPQFMNLAYVRRAIARMIKKKIKLLASGKFYIRGHFKTLTQCPVTFLDWIMNRKDNTLMPEPINGLSANRFYCSNIQADETRTISRNPLNSFSEVLNVTFGRNEVMDKYLGHFSKDILVFNCYDLSPSILSGCDFDLDGCVCCDEEIIKNSVVKDLPLINLDDDKSKAKKLEYNHHNRMEATLKASGNLIGSLSMYGMSVCNMAQEAKYRNYRYIVENDENTGNVYSYQELWNAFSEKHREEYGDSLYEKFVQTLEEKFEEVTDYYSEAELKEQIKEGFFNYRHQSYELRFLQQKAIDAPKTLNMPTDEIPEYYKDLKKPRFLYYAKDYIKKKDTKNLQTALNIHSARIAGELLKEDYEQQRFEDNLPLLKPYMRMEHYANTNQEEYLQCKTELEELYSKYKDEVTQSQYNLCMAQAMRVKKEALQGLIDERKLQVKELKGKYPDDKAFKKKYAKMCRKLDDKKDAVLIKFDEDAVEHKKSLLPQKLKAETECILEADRIIGKYSDEIISHALGCLSCTENFIFKFFFMPVAKVLMLNCADIPKYDYQECDDGEIQYLYKKYKRVEKKLDSKAIDRLHTEGRKQLLNSISKQTLEGFTKEVAIGNCQLAELPFNKVSIKKGTYFDKKIGQNISSIKIFTTEGKEVGFVFKDYVEIDDFRNLFAYVGKEVNFSLINNNGKGRLRAILNYVA